jgi:hypothetical protein
MEVCSLVIHLNTHKVIVVSTRLHLPFNSLREIHPGSLEYLRKRSENEHF